ncbi:MAG: hypothetical protein FWH01_15985 [Oscillospiraceae bacterium]|nr:hypothetical protein [Oscillospiraceae bacterium]
MKTRIAALIFAAALAIMVGCASGGGPQVPEAATPETVDSPPPSPVHVHDLGDATCLEPQTCKECGETVGVPLLHEWVDADCLTPMTCGSCGGTEGEPLPHDWREANYQEPQECLDCGEVEGEPLPAVFLSHGFTLSELGIAHPYITGTYADTSVPTKGRVTVSDFHVIEGDEDREAKEGFEWQVFRVLYEFDDDNARRDGMWWAVMWPCYYEFSLDKDLYLDDRVHTYTINFYGEDYLLDNEEDFVQDVLQSEWIAGKYVRDEINAIRVPVGYDGTVLVFYNTGNHPASRTGDLSEPALRSELIDNDTVFIRLAN